MIVRDECVESVARITLGIIYWQKAGRRGSSDSLEKRSFMGRPEAVWV